MLTQTITLMLLSAVLSAMELHSYFFQLCSHQLCLASPQNHNIELDASNSTSPFAQWSLELVANHTTTWRIKNRLTKQYLQLARQNTSYEMLLIEPAAPAVDSSTRFHIRTHDAAYFMALDETPSIVLRKLDSAQWLLVPVIKKKARQVELVEKKILNDTRRIVRTPLVTLDEILIDNPIDQESYDQLLTGSFIASSANRFTKSYSRTYYIQLEIILSFTSFINQVLTFVSHDLHVNYKDKVKDSVATSTKITNVKQYSLTCNAPPKTLCKCTAGYVRAETKVSFKPVVRTTYEDDTKHTFTMHDKLFTVTETENHELQVAKTVLSKY